VEGAAHRLQPGLQQVQPLRAGLALLAAGRGCGQGVECAGPRPLQGGLPGLEALRRP
jgi:hypothetical protein